MKGGCRLAQKFHNIKAHSEMTEICRYHQLPVHKVIFSQLFFEIVNEIVCVMFRI